MFVVMFYAGKGGVGKSTLAANTAYVLGTRYNVLAMDFSGADRTVTVMLAPGCAAANGIYDVIYSFPEVGGKMALTLCPSELPSLYVVPPGGRENVVLKLDYYVLAQRIDKLMNAVVKRFPFIVIDYPGRQIQHDPLLQALMRHVDLLILVTQPTQSSLNELQAAYNFVLQHYKPPPIIAIVTNMWMGEKTYEESLRTPGGFYLRVKAFPEVYALGRIPKLQYKYCDKCKEFRDAINEIAKHIVEAKAVRRHQIATFFP
jgi:cellulose biosynthesis protein BcsQ